MTRVKWLWLIWGAVFLYGCGTQEDTSKLSRPGKDKIKPGRELLQEGLRTPGEGVLRGAGLSKRKMFLKKGPLKEELKKIRQEARDVGAGDIDDYRLGSKKERLKERVRSIIEKSGDRLSEEEVNKLLLRYVDIPITAGRYEKETEERFKKALAGISREVEELLESKINWAEKGREKEKFKGKLYYILEEKMGPGPVTQRDVNKYFEEYVEKPFKGANQ
ncbi:MAG: hypothetical protein QME81_15210 [bacterium]|nr:hypothetical protein [bacterium]